MYKFATRFPQIQYSVRMTNLVIDDLDVYHIIIPRRDITPLNSTILANNTNNTHRFLLVLLFLTRWCIRIIFTARQVKLTPSCCEVLTQTSAAVGGCTKAG